MSFGDENSGRHWVQGRRKRINQHFWNWVLQNTVWGSERNSGILNYFETLQKIVNIPWIIGGIFVQQLEILE
jgi:hypothetical protein